MAGLKCELNSITAGQGDGSHNSPSPATTPVCYATISAGQDHPFFCSIKIARPGVKKILQAQFQNINCIGRIANAQINGKTAPITIYGWISINVTILDHP
jgi:hypothetical protein